MGMGRGSWPRRHRVRGDMVSHLPMRMAPFSPSMAEGVIGDFAPAPIRQEGGVLGQRTALGLELTELIAAGEDLLGFAGHGDGGGDAVDTEIGDGGVIQAGVEGIGTAAGKVAIVPVSAC